MGEATNEKTSHRRAMTCVRFTDEEMHQIEEDAANIGKSIPALLKERYFKGPRPLPLVSKVDLDNLFGELGRIGNNLNQIARRINSGIRAGFVGEFEEVQKSFDRLLTFLSGKYCRCNVAGRA